MSDLLYLIRMLTAPGGTTLVVYLLLIPYLTYPLSPLTLLTSLSSVDTSPSHQPPALPSLASIPSHYQRITYST